MILLLSCSLSSDSNSRILAQEALRVLQADGVPAELLDLRDHPLPICDGETTYGDQNAAVLGKRILEADAVLLATPIYNYDASSATKNMIELTGKAWENKVVGFLCAAGGMGSYMSIMALANSLMLDFRSLVVPRFVYATGPAIADGQVVDEKIRTRISDLARHTARLARAVKTI